MPRSDVATVLDAYPRIYFACHRRHVYDAGQRRLVSAHQASILDHLDAVESTVLSDLAQHMGVTASTMSLAVDRLERSGYVVRERDATDRRRVRIRLTDAGVRVRRANSVLDPALVARMLEQLPAEQRRDALRGLTLLARAADASRKAAPTVARGTVPRATAP
ncbi:MAG: MarR family winged helix-turn-helix transcriptional regulator [Gemmatimonadaceae bacterium]